MLRKTFFVLIFILTSLYASACGKGGGAPSPQPPNGGQPEVPTVGITAVVTQVGNLWVLGKSGITKPGSSVQARGVGGTTSSALSNSDGSFSIPLPSGALGSILVTYIDRRGLTVHVTLNAVELESFLIRDFLAVGSAPNDMLFTGDKLLVANFSDNTVGIYSRNDFALLKNVELPVGAGPSYLAVFQTIGYVVCNSNNTLYAFNLEDGEDLGSIIFSVELPSGESAFLGPGKPFANEKRVFIPVANIDEFVNPGLSTPYLPAEVIVVDVVNRRIETRIPLTGRNATEVMEYIPGKLLVVEAGSLSFDADYNPFLTTPSFLEVLDAETLEIEESVNLGLFGANSLSYDASTNRIIVGSILEAKLLIVDVGTWTVERERPIELSNERTFIADTFIFDGKLLVSSFNEDKIYTLETKNFEQGVYPLPEPLFVGIEEEGFLAGVQNLFFDVEKSELLFLQGLANRIGKFKLP